MATIVTRSGKGSALSHTEVDANFTNLNTDKVEAGANLSLFTNDANFPAATNGTFVIEVATAVTGGTVAPASSATCYWYKLDDEVALLSFTITNIDTSGLATTDNIILRNFPFSFNGFGANDALLSNYRGIDPSALGVNVLHASTVNLEPAIRIYGSGLGLASSVQMTAEWLTSGANSMSGQIIARLDNF